MALRTFDPSQVSVIFKGTPLSGFADGTFISVTRSNDSYSKTVGADGETTRVASRDKSGEITITLAQTSPSNDFLSSQLEADERDNSGSGDFLIKDNSGNTIIESAAAWVRKPADTEFAKEVSNREWVLDADNLLMSVGGNNLG